MVLSTSVPRSDKLIVGRSRVTRRMAEFAENVAQSEHTVLLRGETGVGKDYLAEFIHLHSKRQRPFVLVDCGALTESLSENELFGHARGAYTDAREVKPGLIEIAAGGTLFFNEVANMSLSLQAKFLRILDKGTYRPVGDLAERPINTRIIAATNADLEDAVRQGQFRLDLYHRLKQIPYVLPPLRERSDDIPALVELFLLQEGFTNKSISISAMAEMQRYAWPGNVRELRNVIIRTAFFTRGEIIGCEHVHPHLTETICPALSFKQLASGSFPKFKDLYDEYIREALRRTRGNLCRAADLTGVTRQTFANKIKELGLGEMIRDLREGKTP